MERSASATIHVTLSVAVRPRFVDHPPSPHSSAPNSEIDIRSPFSIAAFPACGPRTSISSSAGFRDERAGLNAIPGRRACR